MESAKKMIPGLQVSIDYILQKSLTLAKAARQGEVDIIYFRRRFFSEVRIRNPIIYDALVADKFRRYNQLGYDVPMDKIKPDLTDLQVCSKFFL